MSAGGGSSVFPARGGFYGVGFWSPEYLGLERRRGERKRRGRRGRGGLCPAGSSLPSRPTDTEVAPLLVGRFGEEEAPGEIWLKILAAPSRSSESLWVCFAAPSLTSLSLPPILLSALAWLDLFHRSRKEKEREGGRESERFPPLDIFHNWSRCRNHGKSVKVCWRSRRCRWGGKAPGDQSRERGRPARSRQPEPTCNFRYLLRPPPLQNPFP